MAQQLMMDIAQAGDRLDQAALASLRSFINAQIEALNNELEKATTQPIIDSILAQSARLAAKATALTGLSILLTVGEAKVTAEHIKSAVTAAQEVIDEVQSVKARLAKLDAIIDFAAAVLTGSGKAIVEGALALRKALGENE